MKNKIQLWLLLPTYKLKHIEDYFKNNYGVNDVNNRLNKVEYEK